MDAADGFNSSRPCNYCIHIASSWSEARSYGQSRSERPYVRSLVGNKELVAMLLKAGADPNLVTTDNNGTTALKTATLKKHKDIVGLLLTSGADPNIKDTSGKTALAYANSSIAQLLRQAGAKE